MLLSERYIRKIVKEELKGFLFESINARKDLKKYMSDLSKQSGIDLQTLQKFKSTIRSFVSTYTNGYYVGMIYGKPKEEITYGDVLQKLTTMLNLDTPLILDGFSFSYDSNKPVKRYMEFEESQEYFDAITLQFLKQNPSLNAKNINSLISDLSKKEKQEIDAILAKMKEEESAKKNKQTQEWEKIAAPKNALFNKFAFSPQRQGMENPPPREPNNPVENKYLIAIRDHFEGDELLSLEKAQKIKELMQSGLYPDVLKAPTKPVVYRGMTVRKEYLIDNLGVDADQIGSELKELAKTVTFRQTRNASSWTTDFKVAKEFADKNEKGYTGDIYSIVFEANVADNEGNLLDCDGLYDVKELEEFDVEFEVISLEDIVASKMYIHKI
jgi:hypothetical protein